MRINKIAIAILTSFLAPLAVNAATYNSIVHKHSYEIKDATLIPGKETGVQATAENTNTNQTGSSDITKSYINLNTENGDLIEIETDVKDLSNGDMVLTGKWVSSQPISFMFNNKNSAIFYAPDYDGTYYVNLELKDGVYTTTYQGVKLKSEYWTTGDTIYGEWIMDTLVQDWSPDLSTGYENVTMEQTKITDDSRTKQEQETRTSTGENRNLGNEAIETRTGHVETREEYGTMEYWEKTDPEIIQDWTVTEIFQDWTPDASTVYETEIVSQYREVKKERIIQEQEIRPKTGDIRDVGGEISDTTLTTEYQDVQGELEYWENVGTPTCTEWELDRYDAWLPDASNVDRSDTVDQTRIKYESRECTGQQYRPATGEYRNAESEVEYRSETEYQTVYGTLIDLNDWQTLDTSGEWSVSNDGSYAYQAINGAPTIFESKASNFASTKITGKMRVRSAAGDNDWIGMAVGRLDENTYHLWSWKNGSNANSAEKEGHNFAYVTNHSAINWAMDVSKTGYAVMGTKHGTAYGWDHDNYYDFEIIYTPTNVKISVNGSQVLNVNGTFPSGKIGFFNYSQGMVEYYKVTEEPLD